MLCLGSMLKMLFTTVAGWLLHQVECSLQSCRRQTLLGSMQSACDKLLVMTVFNMLKIVVWLQLMAVVRLLKKWRLAEACSLMTWQARWVLAVALLEGNHGSTLVVAGTFIMLLKYRL
jgi:hypothetical protein